MVVTHDFSPKDVENMTKLRAFVDRAGAPRCAMCARPARLPRGSTQYATYCAGKACSNRERLCQACGCTFQRDVNGAGNKYCSLPCKKAGYRQGWMSAPHLPTCAWCDHRSEHPIRRGGAWPYLCISCFDPIRHLYTRLQKHGVTADQAKRITTDPGCDVCGVDIVTKQRRSDGHIRALLVVDHDHRCCEGTYSCGKCVRGFLCFSCNAAAGMLRESPTTAERLAAYLRGDRP